MLQVVASPSIIILIAPEVSFTLLENIYSTGITNDDPNMAIVILALLQNFVVHYPPKTSSVTLSK
jgi:hypothetical protein